MVVVLPLKQFQITFLVSVKMFCLDLSITNLILINMVVLIIYSTIVFLFSSYTIYFEETTF